MYTWLRVANDASSLIVYEEKTNKIWGIRNSFGIWDDKRKLNLDFSIYRYTGATTKILYIDYSDCDKDENKMISLIDEIIPIYNKSTEKINSIACFDKTLGTDKVVKKLEEAGKLYFDKKTNKAVVIGIQGLKLVFLRCFNMIVQNKVFMHTNFFEGINYIMES